MKMLRTTIPGVVALCLALCLARPVGAQAFGGGELERALRPGAYVPYDGAPFSHRYNYDVGPVLYFNGDAQRLWTLEYLDRVDRAERFGYRMPTPPPVVRWPLFGRYSR
jgi:hypothetical protein